MHRALLAATLVTLVPLAALADPPAPAKAAPAADKPKETPSAPRPARPRVVGIVQQPEDVPELTPPRVGTVQEVRPKPPEPGPAAKDAGKDPGKGGVGDAKTPPQPPGTRPNPGPGKPPKPRPPHGKPPRP